MFQLRQCFICVAFIGLALFNSGCTQQGGGPTIMPEKPYCGTPLEQPNNSVQITGSAAYYYRTPSSSGLGPVVSSPNPIRFAEFHVVNSAGAIIQCGETDGSGNFSFSITQSNQHLTLEVLARAFNSHNKASILNDPVNNENYKITLSFVPDTSKALGLVTAPATGTLEGGAFNILDKILDANLFLLNKTAGCSLSGTYKGQTFSCSPFQVASKVTVYWKPGFNPGTYFGNAPNETISFYYPENDRLYICGGVDGDVNYTDTDHFDNAIILHEYAHFLEAHYSRSDSPGGPHNGTKALDPRLVLSEGFANFFQGAVQNLASDPYYIDTIGNSSGKTSTAFYLPLETGTFDSATTPGEGNFREFAITRALYDLADTNQEGANDNVSDKFLEIWTAFTALRTLDVHFRNVGLLYQIQAAITGATDFSTVYTAEQQIGNLNPYGSTSTGPCPFTISSSSQINTYDSRTWPATGELGQAFKFIDFYTSGGTVTFTLNYDTNVNTRDVDMHIYRESHDLFNTSSMVGIDARPDSQDLGNLSITTNLTAGHYLVLVQYFSGTGAVTVNYVRANGVDICPGP